MSFYTQFAPFYEQAFPFREEVYSFLRERALTPGGAVLDAGCGPGHYCGRFLQDGFRVTGIDLDQKMIDAAVEAYPRVKFHCMDISRLDRLQEQFSLIYAIGNVLAHLPADPLERLLSAIHEALPEGGSWIVQVVNWDYLLTLGAYEFPAKRLSGGNAEFRRRYTSISAGRALFEVELVAAGETLFSDQSTLYPCVLSRFMELHEAAGFSCQGVHGGFDCSPFSPKRNSGLVMVFKKM
ncbi:MAG: class I SAM-dependent methyltransferase [Chlorobiaceae bacterium]